MVGSEVVVRSAGHVRIPGRGVVRHEEEGDTAQPRVDTVKER